MKVKIIKDPKERITTKANQVIIKPGDKGKVISLVDADYQDIKEFAEVIKETKTGGLK